MSAPSAPAPYREGIIPNLDPLLAACIPQSGPLHRHLAWAVKTTDAEAVFHLGAILPCWAHTVAAHGFVIDEDHRYVPRLWSMLIGVPASAKSTAMKRAMGLYKRFYASLRSDPRQADPFVIAEGSIPGIFEALAERHDPDLDLSHGVVYRDEAARLLDSKDTSVSDMLCNIIDGEDVKRHLRGARAANREAAGSVKDSLVHPAFSGLLTTTFSRLREVTKASFLEGGLYSRFLWFVGQPKLPEQSLTYSLHRDEEDEVYRSWTDWARWANGQQALGHPLVVRVPPDVVELLRSTLFESLQQHGKSDNRLNAARKRALTQAVQLAGLYALSQCRLFVAPEDMDAAINLVEFSLSGLERLDPSLAVDPFMQGVDGLFHAIASAGEAGLPTAKVYAAVRKSKSIVEGMLDTLVAEGSVRRVAVSTGRPGRPAVLWIANGPARFHGEPLEPAQASEGSEDSPTIN